MAKYLSGGYPTGYVLNGSNSTVTIGGTATIGGIGVVGGMVAAYTILNLGRIAATSTGDAGITLHDGGRIINGGTTDTTALIQGAAGPDGAYNSTGVGGTGGVGGAGVSVAGGGSLGNYAIIGGGGGGNGGASYSASYGDAGAGGVGVAWSGGGSLTNHGTITGGGGGHGAGFFGNGGAGGAGGAGVSLIGGGSLANDDLILGGGGGYGGGGSSRADGGAGGVGVMLSGGASLANSGTIAGGAGGNGPLYGGDGGVGIIVFGGGSVGNTGSILGGAAGSGTGRFGYPGTTGNGVVLMDGGAVTNGDPTHPAALIQGAIGVQGLSATVATVANYGTIEGIVGPAVSLGGGTITNGSTSDTTALIQGATGSYTFNYSAGGSGAAGVSVVGAGILSNYAIVSGGDGGGVGFINNYPGGAGGAGVSWSSGGSITNHGTIAGGAGAVGGATGAGGGVGGAGGAGVSLIGSGSLANSGAIGGGSGGAGGNDRGGAGGAGVAWSSGGSITNHATIFGGAGGNGADGYSGQTGGAGGAGVMLSGGGSVTNSDVITGGAGGAGGARSGTFIATDGGGGAGGAGIMLSAGGWVLNGGTIAGASGGSGGGSSGAAGAFGNGVVVSGGGTVQNESADLIVGRIGVQVLGTAAATVVNYGTIASTYGTVGTAVSFANAADVLAIAAGSTLVGKAAGGGGTLDLAGGAGAGALSGLGSQYSGFVHYTVLAGADWTLTSANTIASGKTLTNYGTIAGTGGTAVSFTNAGDVLVLEGGSVLVGKAVGDGGTLDLAGGGGAGTLTGLGSQYSGFAHYAVLSGADWTLTGANTIASSATFSVAGTLVNDGTLVLDPLQVSGSLDNAGTLTGGVAIASGGQVTNEATGSIAGGAAAAVTGSGGPGTLANFGTISGGAALGVDLTAGGRITNGSSSHTAALIEGGIGVQAFGTAGVTLTNYGTIEGTAGTAVSFANAADTLVIEAGSTLVGKAAGGSGTLDLGGGNGAGTFSGLGGVGSPYSGFAQYAVLSGAHWTLTGSNTIASGETLTVSSGGVLTDPGVLINHGLLAVVNGGKLIVDPATLINSGTVTGAVTLGGGSYLYNAGTVVTAGTAVIGTTSANTVVNKGSIVSTVRDGVDLKAGGTVTNSAGAYIKAAQIGVYIETTPATVVNAGTIAGSIQGVLLGSGGYVSNAATGLIKGAHAIDGSNIFFAAGTATIVNAGTIAGTELGVYLYNGGRITNSGGLITGGYGVYSDNQGATIVNDATIAGTTGAGVRLNGGGIVTNSSGGYISGFNQALFAYFNPATVINAGTFVGVHAAAIALDAGGTVIDSGTIVGGNGVAVYFAGGGNLLELQPGYKLDGSVDGGSGSTLELGGTSGSPLTVNYNALNLSGFSDVLFGTGGNDTLDVSNVGATLPVTVQGFSLTSDVIDLTTIGTNGAISAQSSTSVTITGLHGSETLKLDGSDGTNFTTQSDGASGTELIACFCRGTRILTPDGEVAVEELTIGTRVVTLSGEARPVRWIGRRAYGPRFIAGNKAVLPICIAAGALAENVPARDLFVSPEHAMVIDGLFLPARLLVNGTAIRQVEAAADLEYFHVELDSHDVIFAEGAAAESFIDVGGRGVFHNAAEFAARYPEAEPAAWEPYEALLRAGEAALPRVRADLLARAVALGLATPDPDLHLIVDGEAMRAPSPDGRAYTFVLPAAVRQVTLASRSVVPQDSEPAGSLDQRRLGVPFERATLEAGGVRLEIGPDCPALCDGFHRDEGSHRWTDGQAVLPPQFLACLDGDIALTVLIGATELHYSGAPPRRPSIDPLAGLDPAI